MHTQKLYLLAQFISNWLLQCNSSLVFTLSTEKYFKNEGEGFFLEFEPSVQVSPIRGDSFKLVHQEKK